MTLFRIKKDKESNTYAVQLGKYHSGMEGRTADMIDDDAGGGYTKWVTKSHHTAFEDAQIARDKLRYAEPDDCGFSAFMANCPRSWR